MNLKTSFFGLSAFLLLAFPLSSVEIQPESSSPPYLERLTFEEAVGRVLAYSPELKASAEEIKMGYAEVIQSSKYPNPVAAYTVEDIFGNKKWRGWRSADSKYEIEQLIQTGGKRHFRSLTAKYEFCATKAGYEARKLYVINRVLKLFVDVASSQELCKISEMEKNASEEFHKTIIAKVHAGKISQIQQSKANISLAVAQIEHEKALTDLRKAKERLSRQWGSLIPDFDEVELTFYDLNPPEDLETYLSGLALHPEIIQWQMKYKAANENWRLEKAEAIPDVVITVGCKTLQDRGEKGMILGAFFPIPLFDQNQGNIMKARSKREQIQNLFQDLMQFLEIKLSTTYKDVMRSYEEAKLLESTVLKAALRSFDDAFKGYQEGKFDYLEMLDAQKTLIAMKEKYIQALQNFHKSKADMEYLNSQDN